MNDTRGFLYVREELKELLPFTKLAEMLGSGTTEDVELCFVGGMPPVSSDIIRAHSYLDPKIYRVKGWYEGNENNYNIYKTVPEDLRFESHVDFSGETGKKLRQILECEPGIKLKANRLTHETIASINDILPVCKIKYFGLTADELRRMAFDKRNIEKAMFDSEYGFSGLPVNGTKVEYSASNLSMKYQNA